MDADLKQYLEGMESRLGDGFQTLETRLNDRFQTLETRLNDLEIHVNDVETRLRDRIESTETKLLKAFYDGARPVEIRLRTLPMLEERLGLLEERISKIERGDRPSLDRAS